MVEGRCDSKKPLESQQIETAAALTWQAKTSVLFETTHQLGESSYETPRPWPPNHTLLTCNMQWKKPERLGLVFILHVQAIRLRTRNCIGLSCSFLICKMGVLVLTFQGYGEMYGDSKCEQSSRPGVGLM